MKSESKYSFLAFILRQLYYNKNGDLVQFIISEFKKNLGSIEPHFYLEVDGVKLAIHDSAPHSLNTVIVCLHAIGHGGADFKYFIDYFKDSYRIITIDCPGQGYSFPDQQKVSAERYSQLLNQVIIHLDIRKCILLGNSIGGAASILYTYHHPENVSALILSNPGGLDRGGFFAKLFIWNLERKFSKGVQKNQNYLNWFKNYYEKILITEHSYNTRKNIIDSAYEISPLLKEAWHSFRMPNSDLRKYIPQIETPVFFAWAIKDKLVSYDRNKKSIEMFKNRSVEFFEAGHAPFLETPEQFNRAANTFFKKLH